MKSRLFLDPPKTRAIISHTPGVSIWLSSSKHILRCYPMRLFLEKDPLGAQSKDNEIFEFELPIQGPVKEWTVRRHLKKNEIEIEGRDIDGHFFRYTVIDTSAKVLFCHDEKTMAVYEIDSEEKSVVVEPVVFDLGGYRDLVWEKIGKNILEPRDLREFIQTLFYIAPPQKPSSKIEKKLLESNSMLSCLYSLKVRDTKELFFLVRGILETSVTSIFSLQLQDSNFLGYSLPAFPVGLTTDEVLQTLSYALSLMLFSFSKGEDNSDLLTFHKMFIDLFPSGRIWNFSLFSPYTISYEWRKSAPRRIAIFSNEDRALTIDFGSKIEKVFVRQKSKTQKKSAASNRERFHLKADIEYLYDNFR